MLGFLSASLKDDGTLIISSHGSYVYGELKRGANYGIDTSRSGFFLSYLFQGYAYQDYSGENNYGISVISQRWWRKNAKKVGLSLRR